MKPYGIERKDRVICSKRGCGCGDFSSKHPTVNVKHPKNKRLKKRARRLLKVTI